MDPAAIQRLAPLFEKIVVPDPAATVFYDCLSDALIWSDELPEDRSADEWWDVRPVLHFRTGLIIASPRSQYQEVWGVAKASFANWVGFRPERCQRSDELAQFYFRQNSAAGL